MFASTSVFCLIFWPSYCACPWSFFETKQTGDILQRIQDHSRIEQFLTGSSLSVLFSLVNLAVFGLVLAYYNLPIFGVFMLGSGLYAGWVMLFLRVRRKLDHKRFALASAGQSSLIQLVTGVQELKLQKAPASNSNAGSGRTCRYVSFGL